MYARDINNINRSVQSMWCDNYECPGKLKSEWDFDKGNYSNWWKTRGTRFALVIVAQNNKNAFVGRNKNILKNLPENLEADASTGTTKVLLKVENFKNQERSSASCRGFIQEYFTYYLGFD